jgi:hypothetical protein
MDLRGGGEGGFLKPLKGRPNSSSRLETSGIVLFFFFFILKKKGADLLNLNVLTWVQPYPGKCSRSK